MESQFDALTSKRLRRRRLISCSTCSVLLVLSALSAHAEIVTDGSVGPATNLSGAMLIPQSLGTVRDGNLFHSFTTFNIGSAESATFTATDSFNNVVSRVTGGSLSRIDGVLASEVLRADLSGADLWVVNSAGVVFGTGASLNVPGGLHIGSADFVEFSDGYKYGTANPAALPRLLVAAPSSFGFLSAPSGVITVAGANLVVTSGANLEMTAGTIGIAGGLISTSSITAADAGNIFINTAALNLTAGGQILASAQMSGNAGSVTINAGDGVINIADAGLVSVASTGVELTAGAAGSVHLLADRITVANGGQIAASNSGGQGGQVYLNADLLEVQSDGMVIASTSGTGAGGEVNVSGDGLNDNVWLTVDVDGGSMIAAASSSGDAGNVNILTGVDEFLKASVTVRNKGSITSSSSGTDANAGKAGNVQIVAGTVTVETDGTIAARTVMNPFQFVSNNGAVNMWVDTLQLRSGGQVRADSTGRGYTGGIVVQGWTPGAAGACPPCLPDVAGLVEVSGIGQVLDETTNELRRSGLFSGSIGTGANAGDLSSRMFIVADRITVTDQGQISGDTVDGSAGFLELYTDRLEVRSGGLVTASSGGAGSGGSVFVGDDGVGYIGDGREPDGQLVVLVDGGSITTASEGSGSAGQVSISGGPPIALNNNLNAQAVTVTNGGLISSSATASGDSGTVTIRANMVSVEEQGRLEANTKDGLGGSVNLKTNRLEVLRGGQITATTSGAGEGGQVGLGEFYFGIENDGHLPLVVVVDGGAISTAASGVGDAGNIVVLSSTDAVSIDVKNGSLISSSSTGSMNSNSPNFIGTGNTPGAAGSVDLLAGTIRVTTGATVAATSVDGQRKADNDGEISLTADLLEVESGGQVRVDTSGAGDAGSILVDAGQVTMTNNGQISVRAMGSGNAGRVVIQGLDAPPVGGDSLLLWYGQIDAQALEGNGGSVLILTADEGVGTVRLDGGTILAVSNGSDPTASQGSILIAGPRSTIEDSNNSTAGPRRVILENRSLISANSGNPNAGNVTVNARAIAIDGTSAMRATGDVFTIGSLLGSTQEIPEAAPVDASDDLVTRCTPAEIVGRSTFVLRGTRPADIRAPYLPVDGLASAVMGNQSVVCAAQSPSP